MKKKKKLFRWVVIGFLILFFAPQAQAVLTVNFTEDIRSEDRARIQYYWNVDVNTPNVYGRTINSAPTVILDLSDPNRQAKVDPSPRAFHFGCDERFPGSTYIYMRLWDNKYRNHYYTDLRGFSNTALGTVISNFGTITYRYVKANPGTAVINQYDETATTVFSPSASSSRRVTFSSVQPSRPDGKEVEIPQSIWSITYNGTTLDARRVAGKNLTLQAPADSLNPGDIYVVKVKHVNHWGEQSDRWSDPVRYVVGAAGGGVSSVTYNFVSTGLGLNQFALPFLAKHDGVNIDNVQQLVEGINAAAGASAVTSIGWWDETAQIDKGYVVTYSGGTLIFSPVNGAADPATERVVTGRSYQVVVNSNFSITFTSR